MARKNKAAAAKEAPPEAKPQGEVLQPAASPAELKPARHGSKAGKGLKRPRTDAEGQSASAAGSAGSAEAKPEDSADAKKPQKVRKHPAVFVTRCPPDTKQADLQRLFPKAHKVTVFQRDGRCTGTAVLRFRAPSHAAAAVAASGLRLRGHSLAVAERGKDRPNPPSQAASALSEDDLQRTVFIAGCPLDTTEEELTGSFPAVEKVTMLQTRGAFAGRGFLLFPTAAEAQAVAKQSSATVRGVVVRVAMAESPETSRQRRAEQNCRTVLARPWVPATMAEAGARALFPNVERLDVMERPAGRHTCCFLLFPTVAEAEAAAGRSPATIKGTSVQLKVLSGSPPSPAPAKRPAEEAPSEGDAKKKRAKKAKHSAD
eukprot:EG_transcript_14293